MKKKDAAKYLAAVTVAFLLGCAGALGLRAYDLRADSPQPLTGGALHALPGLTLRLPDGFSLANLADERAAADGVLFDALAQGDEGTLLLHGYANAQGDDIAGYAERQLVAYYVNAGCRDVRTRTLSGRRFVCYGALANAADEPQLWHVYETWDAALHLVIETQLPPRDALPILSTIEFAASAAK